MTSIILSAGLSTRMPSLNKMSLLTKEGKTFLQHTVDEQDNLGLHKIVVVTSSENRDYLNLSNLKTSTQVFINPEPEKGLVSSLKIALLNSEMTSNSIMISLSDMPLLKSEDYQSLIQYYEANYSQDRIVRPYQNDNPGNPVIFSVHYKQALLENNNEISNREIIRKNVNHLRKYQTDNQSYFIDIDTQEEYEAYMLS